VKERAEQLSTMPPTRRPPYLKMMPLGPVIARVLGAASPNTKKVKVLYDSFIDVFDNEIAVLLDVPQNELAGVSPEVADSVLCMREGRVTLIPGGGGRYGSFSF
jgi:PHP family Zn ribbon phosphoesterase